MPGVTGVFYGSDFITVTKDDGDWQHLKPAILGAIMEHLHVRRADAGGRQRADDDARMRTTNSSTRPTPKPST